MFGGRWNPLHQMLATGTDAVAGVQDGGGKAHLRHADDAINLPLDPLGRAGGYLAR